MNHFLTFGAGKKFIQAKDRLVIQAEKTGIFDYVVSYIDEDLKEIPDNVKEDLEIHPVRWIDEVLQLSLSEQPELLEDELEIKPAVIAQTGKKGKKKARVVRN